MVTFLVLLLGIVSGGPSAPAPSAAPPAAAPAPATTVTVTIHPAAPASAPHAAARELMDPFFAPGPRVAIAVGDGRGLLDPFAPAQLAARLRPAPVHASRTATTADGLHNPFAT